MVKNGPFLWRPQPDLAEKLTSVGRMGGIDYARTTDRFGMEHPLIAPEDPRSIPAGKAANVYGDRGEVGGT